MSAATAVSAFKAQFKAKAAVNWEQRHGMIAKKGEYNRNLTWPVCTYMGVGYREIPVDR